MGVSKVEFGNQTVIDLTNDTVNENNLLSGATAHGADGEPIHGNVIVHNVVDSLSSTSSEDALSAKQGKILNDGKQDKLSTQTAYSAKGSATKVPQITTNALGQVTGIKEVPITDKDTKNTAGSTNSTSKLFLVGTTSQAANPQTYSDANTYVQNGTFHTKTVQAENLLLDSETLTANKVIYVSPTGNDTTGDGTNTKPYKTIGKAVRMLPSTDSFNASSAYQTDIYIAAGTYTEPNNICLVNKKTRLILNGDVTINFGASTLYGISLYNSFIIIQGNSSTTANFRILNLSGSTCPIRVELGSYLLMQYISELNISNFNNIVPFVVIYDSTLELGLSSCSINVDYTGYTGTTTYIRGFTIERHCLLYANIKEFKIVYPTTMVERNPFYATVGSHISVERFNFNDADWTIAYTIDYNSMLSYNRTYFTKKDGIDYRVFRGSFVTSGTSTKQSYEFGSNDAPANGINTTHLAVFDGNKKDTIYAVNDSTATASANGVARLRLGCAEHDGFKSSKGSLQLYTENNKLTNLNPGSPSENINVVLPNTAGTLALDTVATKSANGLMSSTDKTNWDAIYSNYALATCATARETVAKVATLSGFVLKVGAMIAVKFTSTSATAPTSGNITLNVNNTGAKTVRYFRNGSFATLTYSANAIFYNNITHLFVYDGTYWQCMTYNADNNDNTKNTAGSTDTSKKIFLIGAESQAANPQTYSDDEVYATNGVLTTKSTQIGGGKATMQYNATNDCIDFVFS